MKTLVLQTIEWKPCLFEMFIISLLYCVPWRQNRQLLRTPCREGECKRFVVSSSVLSLLLCRKMRWLRLFRSRNASRNECTKILLLILSVDNCGISWKIDRKYGIIFTQFQKPELTLIVIKYFPHLHTVLFVNMFNVCVFPSLPTIRNGLDRFISSIRVTPWGAIYAAAQREVLCDGLVDGWSRYKHRIVQPHGTRSWMEVVCLRMVTSVYFVIICVVLKKKIRHILHISLLST